MRNCVVKIGSLTAVIIALLIVAVSVQAQMELIPLFRLEHDGAVNGAVWNTAET